MTFKEGAQVCSTSQSCHELDLSHTHVRVKSAIKCGTPTRLRKMCVRRGVLSSPSFAQKLGTHDFNLFGLFWNVNCAEQSDFGQF